MDDRAGSSRAAFGTTQAVSLAAVVELDAWPESTEELLELIERFDRLQKKYAKQYTLSLSIFGVLTTRAEIDAVLKAGDKLTAATLLHSRKIDFWS